MRFKSMIAVVLAVATGTLAGAGHAAMVPVVQSLTLFNPQDSLVYNIATDGQAAASTTIYYELVVDPSWTAPTMALMDIPGKNLSLFHAALLSARHYILHINTLPGQFSIGAHISSSGIYSSVPLPGAVLLFGSSVLAFLGLSRRRKL